ncbi:protein MFI isoform 3-T3 [Hipposideros larvatus]
MPWIQELEFTERDRAARVIQKAWKSFLFWMSTEDVMVGNKKETKFHFSKLKRRQDMEKKRKTRKIEWMKQMYYTGNLKAKSTNSETTDLIHKATEGLIRVIEGGGVDSVMDWEVDEVLNWTNALNFDEYIANWKEIATSNSSANCKNKQMPNAVTCSRSHGSCEGLRQASWLQNPCSSRGLPLLPLVVSQCAWNHSTLAFWLCPGLASVLIMSHSPRHSQQSSHHWPLACSSNTLWFPLWGFNGVDGLLKNSFSNYLHLRAGSCLCFVCYKVPSV